APSEYDTDVIGFRYFWNMTVLIFLEAPLASVFIVAYLGPAVFLEDRTIRQVAGDVLRQSAALFLCQGLLRGVLIAWALYLLTDRLEGNGFIEGFLMFVLCGWAAAMRAFWAVVRFLSFLDLGIRQEGWEVELLMRAEALRLTMPLA